ncbi:MAG TPA: thymidine phosphorylase, partial [bacterium]
GKKVDKHSTGGVGDKASLIVAPIVASLGVPVPMISGRGLGHTGGTLDKLESIPGFRTDLSAEEFVRQLGDVGCALIGQTAHIVPADRKMYALRDATCTVQSLPLIVGSILSKKIAEGANALLLDVKFGRGALFPNLAEAGKLAQHLVGIGTELGLEVRALLSDMDQPLGMAVGNWLEVVECLQILNGEARPKDLVELSLAQSALMLVMGEKAQDYQSAYGLAENALNSGKALTKFMEIAQRQGADIRYLEKPSLYRQAGCSRTILTDSAGYIAKLDALAIGQAAVQLGAGRRQKEDRIDYSAGILLHHKVGDRVAKGYPLATVYSASEEIIRAILPDLVSSFKISDEPPPIRSLILSMISPAGETAWPLATES